MLVPLVYLWKGRPTLHYTQHKHGRHHYHQEEEEGAYPTSAHEIRHQPDTTTVGHQGTGRTEGEEWNVLLFYLKEGGGGEHVRQCVRQSGLGGLGGRTERRGWEREGGGGVGRFSGRPNFFIKYGPLVHAKKRRYGSQVHSRAAAR